jgi:hypothetical protein
MSDRQQKHRDDAKTSQSDLAPEIMGRNALQGDDQANVRNERKARPDVRQKADDVVESFEKLDKDTRARTDLGKNNRSD